MAPLPGLLLGLEGVLQRGQACGEAGACGASVWLLAVRWGLPAAGALVLGGAAALMTAHRDDLRQLFDHSAATLAGLAHVASSLLRQ